MISEAEAIITDNKENLFKEIVDNYKLMVTNTCYGLVHSIHDADDLAQEVFLEVWQKLDCFRGDSKISTWLYRIAVNKSLNFVRQNKKNRVLCAMESIKENLFNYTSDNNVEEREDNNTKIKIIHKAISRLPERQKSAFVLFHYEGLNYKEIADITNSTVPSVESLLFRARTNLRKYLKDFNYRYEE